MNGTSAADTLARRLDPQRPTRVEVDFEDDPSLRVDRTRIDRIMVSALDGADRVRINDAQLAFSGRS